MSGPRLTRVTLIALLALAAAEPLFSQSTPGISDSALQQIQNILAEKRSRTSTQIKLDPTLLYTARTAAGLSTGTVSDVVAPTATLDTSGRVQADIRAAVSDALLVRIQNLGGEIVSAFPQYGAIRANLPILQVENVAGAAVGRGRWWRTKTWGGKLLSPFLKSAGSRATLPILQVENVAGDPDVQ